MALIKGGGGKLLREKIVASASKRFIIVADESKLVPQLGAFPLPVEVIRMAVPLVTARLQELGFTPKIRQAKDGSGMYITDEGNLLLDCASSGIADPEETAAEIRSIVGVVEHGLFLGMAERALIAGEDGCARAYGRGPVVSSPVQPKQPLILASASPRRRELLGQIGLEFTVVTADIDETPLPGEDHRSYTLRLADAKARAVLALHPHAVVIGADTTVAVAGELLGKPLDAEDAARMLRLLRGRGHEVTTGIAVLTRDQTWTACETTEVFFSEMTDADITAYVSTGEPMDKAGAYAIQGRAAQWIPRIAGEYSNVVGLPLSRLAGLLKLVTPSS